MITRLQAEAFLKQSHALTVLDVRSPSEFIQGHIPGAFSLPLFTDEERALVGIRYKNSGRDFAVKLGLQIVGPKLSWYAEEARRLAPARKVLVHCWRGGMRSESIAWLLQISGFEVQLLDGGYKAYRGYIRGQLALAAKMMVLGGLTGSGKSAVLKQLATKGHQVLDLETLANHKGSVFGGLGQPTQPNTEQFENNIYPVWEAFDLSKTIWVEDESRAIGSVNIPEVLFQTMMKSPIALMEVPFEIRVERLVAEYGGMPVDGLAEAIMRIKDSLGGPATRGAMEALGRGDFHVIARLALAHYDRLYSQSLTRRNDRVAYRLPVAMDDPVSAATGLIKLDASNQARI
jgi:tRNA 2-selenouridine synthase